MIGQKALLELMTKAIDAEYFNDDFLKALNKKISDHLNAGG